ncbi:MAG: hypothetical protein GWO24_29030, partial [Akkermansiaceae bacterium]|nr:hypothetical protein [Akkermansiaceae bacterium]
MQKRDWTNVELTGAGVSEKTEVYLTIEDQTTGGWGNVSVDNIVVENALFPSGAPDIRSFTSNPPSLTAPGNVTLEWEVEDAVSLSIDNGVGEVTGLSSKEVAV